MIFYCIFTFVAVKLSPEDVALFQQAEGVCIVLKKVDSQTSQTRVNLNQETTSTPLKRGRLARWMGIMGRMGVVGGWEHWLVGINTIKGGQSMWLSA